MCLCVPAVLTIFLRAMYFAGPAGTGKTESSKDLAKALAIPCIVFNCGEQISYITIGLLFAGLAQSGAWACLDEFNRINVEVLSVIAQQLLVLRAARLQEESHTMFEGRKIAVREHHVIVTMNPGYAGRTELPDNLKASVLSLVALVEGVPCCRSLLVGGVVARRSSSAPWR
jgi:dynein heavy chain, axonemal